MKNKLINKIINKKVSLIIDESTSVSNKSVLAVYIRLSYFDSDNVSDEAFSFLLGLVELDSLSADSITKKLLSYLRLNKFSDQYLSKNLIRVCSDGASTMVGKSSGVLTQLKEQFPNIFLWHCMCHRIELAVSDAVKFSSQVNHVQIFLDKLYSLYNQPKAQRELSKCASQLDIQMRKIGRVLGVRWAASSFRTVDAIWHCYPALIQHAQESSSNKSSIRVF